MQDLGALVSSLGACLKEPLSRAPKVKGLAAALGTGTAAIMQCLVSPAIKHA
jgi:hypothetical protein